jgi:ABC-type sugar transport system permease subunit
MPYEKKRKLLGAVFVIPWTVGFIYFFLVPLVYAFIFSLNDLRILETGIEYTPIWFKNYIEAFTTDTTFVILITRSLPGILFQLPMIVLFSLFLSLILNVKFRGRIYVRAIFFLPVIIASGVIINILTNDSISSSMMSGETGSMLFRGIEFQSMLVTFGLPGSIIEAIMSIVNGVFELIWKSGVQTLLFLSALQSVPVSVYEAADTEGATAWEKFWKITFPLISPQMVLCIFYTIVDTSTDYSNLIIRYISSLARQQQFSHSSALSIIWFLIVALVVGIAFLVMRNKVEYMEDRG